MGTTTAGGPKRTTLGFRVSESDAHLVRALAAKRGRNVSEHLRELAMRDVQAEFGETPQRLQKPVPQLERSMSHDR